jgi:small subunit ribosomal protein S20
MHNVNNNKELEKMPIKKSAWKETRKSKLRHERNISVKSDLKTFMRKLESLVSAKKKEEALAIYKLVASKLDRAASRNVIHKNTASRKKSRLMKRVSKIA